MGGTESGRRMNKSGDRLQRRKHAISSTRLIGLSSEVSDLGKRRSLLTIYYSLIRTRLLGTIFNRPTLDRE